MLPKPKECSSCIIGHYKNSGFIQPEGTCKNGVLIIGEAPGENEKNDALPFRPYAESGSALQTCIGLLKKYNYKWERSDFAFWNLIACQPSFNKLEGTKFEEEAILTCRANYFNQVISYYKPKVILGLGNLTVKHLVPEIDAIRTSLKGRIQDAKLSKDKAEIKRLQSQLSKLKIGNIRGYKFNSLYGIPFVASFHPSFITRGGRELLGVLLRDLMFALEIAEGKWEEDYKFENYIENPDVSDLQKFFSYCRNHPKLPISYDIETPFTTLQVDETEIEFGQEVRDIESIQFSIPVANSLSNGNIRTRSIFLDWEGNIEGIKEILELPNSKVGWNNWKFDETNLQYHLGKDAINGIRYDAMWLFKHLNADFRKTGRALQFAANFYIPNLPAWKHLSEDEPRKYGLIDVDATLKTYLGLKKELEGAKSPAYNSKTLWQGYEDDIVKLYPILQDMTRRGFPINLEEREKFKISCLKKASEVLEELQEVYPTILRRPDPQLGYKVVPKEVAELAAKFGEEFCNIDSPNYTIFLDDDLKNLTFAQYLEKNTRRKDEDIKKDVSGQTGLVVKSFILENGARVKRYCRLDRFKPNSTPQKLAYIKYKGYKIKIKRKGKEQTETSDKNAMYDLYEETNDPFFLKVGLYTELIKFVSTYIKGWPVDNEGRVHAEFAPYPASGQWSCSPNIQNAPGHGTRYNSSEYVELAKQFRNSVQPKSGHTFVELDYTGFHAGMLGFEADDYASLNNGGDSAYNYIRLSRLGVHDFLAAYMVRNEYLSRKRVIVVGQQSKVQIDKLREETLEITKDLDKWLEYDDSILATKLSWIKKNHEHVRNSQAKPAVHGVGFGMGVHKFYTLNKHAFASLEEPRRILLLLRKLFPDIFIWQEYIKELAHNQTYLMSRYGYIRYFWDVYDWRMLPTYRAPKSEYEKVIITKEGKIWSRTDGQQVKECIAYFPSNNAFGKKKEAIRELEAHDYLNKWRWVLDNHDSLLFEVPDAFVDECVVEGAKIMAAPAKHLISKRFPNGIPCKVDAKIGKAWGSMKGYEI
jgi:uracil-DNA glycosylase family 4